MTETLLVLIGDTTAGVVTRSQAGKLHFTYDDDYRVRPGATPLSVSMPIQVRSPGNTHRPGLRGGSSLRTTGTP